MNLREYETIFILRPDIGEEETAKVLERVKEAIASKDGVILREQKWGKKRLAYEVKKHLKGYFYYFQYVGPAGVVEEFERIMKLLEAVMKFQTVKLDDFVDVEKRQAEIQKETEELNKPAEEEVAKTEDAKTEKAKEEEKPSEEPKAEATEEPKAEEAATKE